MVIKRSTDGTYSTPTSLYSSDASIAEDFLFSGLCELEDGSIICVHWTVDEDDELAQVNVHRTEDEGTTWSQVSTEAVPFDQTNLSIENKGSFGAGTAGVDLSDIRVRSIGGQTLMTAHIIKHNTTLGNAAPVLLQYLSTNQGLTYDLIAENNDAGYFSHGLQVVNGTFHVSYIEYPASPRVLVIGAMASATSPISSSIKYDISTDTDFQTGTAFTHEGELSVWIDTDGKYYAIARQIQGTSSWEDTTQIFQSDDGGKNWSGMGTGGSVFTNQPAGQINNFLTAPVLHLTNFVGCSQGGEGLVFHNTAGSGASSYNEILGCLQIGGYSTVTAPPYVLFADDTRRMRWAINWFGVQVPDSVGWGIVGAGTDTLQNGYLNITTDATNEKYFTRTSLSGGLQSGMIARVHIKVTTGAILKPILQLQISDGSSTSYKVSVRASATQLDLYDEEAGARVGSLRSVDMTEEADILLAISDSNVYAWYRENMVSSERHRIVSNMVESCELVQLDKWNGHDSIYVLRRNRHRLNP
jgi:hypothetical protein